MANYSILPGDLVALAPLIGAENDLRQMLGSAPSQALTDFMARIDALGRSAYPTSSGSQIQSWVDELFITLMQTTTLTLNYFHQPTDPLSVTCVYVAYAYTDWLTHPGSKPCIPSTSSAVCYGCFVASDECMIQIPPIPSPWPRPQHSTAWNTSISQVIDFENASTQLFEVLATFPKFWTDYANVPMNSTLWKEQAAALQSLQSQSSLAAGQCPFLLYLLLAQSTSSDPNDQKLVDTISSVPVSSPELTYSTFADQLVYFTLMYLNDPRGSINWTNQQLLDFVSNLLAAIPANPASSTFSAVLTEQQKTLKAYACYPGIDPNNPNTPFNERYSDVLAAMNMVWPTITS